MITFSRDELKKDILINLGNETLPVELEDSDLELSINLAVDRYSQYKPLLVRESYSVPHVGINKQDMPADVLGISSVEITQAINSLINSGLQIESALLSGVPVYYGTGDISYDIDYLALRRQWIRTVSKQLGGDPDYAIIKDPVTNIFSIWTFSTSLLMVDVVTTKEYARDLSNFPYYNRMWLYRWALSEATLILANKRGKFASGIPVAGGHVKLNADQLRSDARVIQNDLMNEMFSSRADLYPRIGG